MRYAWCTMRLSPLQDSITTYARQHGSITPAAAVALTAGGGEPTNARRAAGHRSGGGLPQERRAGGLTAAQSHGQSHSQSHNGFSAYLRECRKMCDCLVLLHVRLGFEGA